VSSASFGSCKDGFALGVNEKAAAFRFANAREHAIWETAHVVGRKVLLDPLADPRTLATLDPRRARMLNDAHAPP
jgi:hypothetical protein